MIDPSLRIDLRRLIIELQGENAMLVNALQRAQRLVAEERYADADKVLTRAIEKILSEDRPLPWERP